MFDAPIHVRFSPDSDRKSEFPQKAMLAKCTELRQGQDAPVKERPPRGGLSFIRTDQTAW
jgi:hypothetical protein